MRAFTRNNLALICLLLALVNFACLKREKQVSDVRISPDANALNLNTASSDELEKLPKIGADIARRIVEHREKYGRFERPEELLLLRGVSEKRFREMRSFVKTE